MPRSLRRLTLIAGCWAAFITPIIASSLAVASPIDQLSDLTGRVSVVVTLKGRDNFNSEYRYDVSAKNLSSETFAGDSLYIVLDKVTNIGGEERENLNSDPILSRMDVLGQEGETSDGKPYFRIPPGANPDLVPYSQSLPVSIRLRNKDYMIVFTPSFKVYGARRPPPEPKQQSQAQPPSPSTNPRHQAQERQTDKLIQLLLKKGVITEEEWRKANQP
ncbi:conserved protein of unknown function [Nitrospira japonica]|uniref:Uncharacterized protein n=1 Tax=Nitrospira japonica TaxID=1325564 RepID=A0A1W1I550_9BACT|nr:hypothetical protein [Nitrospira japonica]SLM48148.1 conserved protein of unknown function [Nitrospira japonica]